MSIRDRERRQVRTGIPPPYSEVLQQCCGAGAAWSRHFLGGSGAGRFFFWSEPGAGAALFKAAPAASFRQAKKKSLVLVSNMTLKAV